jgi:transglutaminase-like putative cysteine protease
VKAEFFAEGIGWVPVDISSAITQHDVSASFGRDNGDFIVMNFDYLTFDDVPRTFQIVQCPWVLGKYHGSWEGWTDTRDIKVATLSPPGASPR